jgi:DNA repair protein RadD
VSVVLRDYQAEGTSRLRCEYAGGKRAVLFVLATGGGKTICFAYITHGAASKRKRVLIVAHRRELIKQASRKLSEAGVEHGIIAPGFTPTHDAVQVASIQTLANRLDKIGQFDLIVVDEGHHAVAGTYVKLIASQSSAKLLLVTATPERLDGRGLGITAGGCCDAMVIGPSSGALIREGYLTPIRVFAPPTGPDLSGVKIRMGDYEKAGLAAAMSAPTLVGDAVEHYARHAPGKPSVAFCVSVEHARGVAQTFRAAGWRAVAADGSMATAERDAALGGLATGTVQVLCVCDLVSEGLDIPGISVVIILRATRSLVNFLQWIGRGLRPVYSPGFDMETSDGRMASIAASEKPHCLVLDHAGCTLTHGMPDADRDWSLDGRPKKQKAPPTKQCPECFAIHAPAPECPVCGHSYESEIKEAREMQVVAGQLAEIDAAALARLKSAPLHALLKTATTREDLEKIRKARGYKAGWIRHVLREREGAQA